MENRCQDFGSIIDPEGLRVIPHLAGLFADYYLTQILRICYSKCSKKMLNEVKHFGSGYPGKPAF
jgi:hypothetical protein